MRARLGQEVALRYVESRTQTMVGAGLDRPGRGRGRQALLEDEKLRLAVFVFGAPRQPQDGLADEESANDQQGHGHYSGHSAAVAEGFENGRIHRDPQHGQIPDDPSEELETTDKARQDATTEAGGVRLQQLEVSNTFPDADFANSRSFCPKTKRFGVG